MSQEEGLSTGHFDSDRGDLSCDSVPKIESPGGGFGPSAEVDPGRSTCDPILTSQITGLGSGGGGTLSRSSSGDIGPGVPCERRLQGNWVFPRTCSPPDDDRDKTDAASSS